MHDIINMQGLDINSGNAEKKYEEEANLRFIRANSRGDGLGLSRRAAITMITDYWKDKKEAYRNSDKSVLDDNVAITFDKEALLLLLSQAGCDKIRFYFCKNHDNNTSLVMVGAGQDNHDITSADARGSIIPCDKSELNSVVNSRSSEEATLIMEVGGPKTFREFLDQSELEGSFNAASDPENFNFEANLGHTIKDFFDSE